MISYYVLLVATPWNNKKEQVMMYLLKKYTFILQRREQLILASTRNCCTREYSQVALLAWKYSHFLISEDTCTRTHGTRTRAMLYSYSRTRVALLAIGTVYISRVLLLLLRHYLAVSVVCLSLL